MPQPDAERAALDAQYNLRAAVPEHLTYFARYEGDSAALRARWPGKLDLAYGPTPRQAIDLFLPAGCHRRADPGVHPRRLLAEPRSQGFLLCRRSMAGARGRGRAARLRPRADRAYGCDRRAGARRPCLALPPGVRPRLRPQAAACRRPFRRRPSGGSHSGDGLGELGSARKHDQRGLRDQRRIRSRAHPPVLSQRGRRSRCGRGAPQQPAPSAAAWPLPGDRGRG